MTRITPGRFPTASGAWQGRASWRLAAWLLAAAALAVFGPAVGSDFVHFDDNHYVTENPHVLGGLTWGGLNWAFATDNENYWHPLAFVSHMLDVELFGLDPWGHHLTSVLLHTANALLLFWALGAMTGDLWRSAFVACVFAVHPLQVEPVAWVAERKTVLAVFFLLLSLLAYVRHARRPSLWAYAAAAAAFLASLLSKPLGVFFPAALLALDYWPLRRAGSRRALFLEKVPLLLLAAASCAATLGSARYVSDIPLWVRAGHSAGFYLEYIGLILWPRGLAVFHPYPPDPPGALALAGAGFLAATAWLCWRLRRGQPFLAVGWCWYVGFLLPVVGLVAVGAHGLADRGAYLPLVGPALALAWAVRPPAATAAKTVALAAAALMGLCVASSRQLGHWSDSVSLFTRALRVAPQSELLHLHMGFSLFDRGSIEEAQAHYRRALALRPGYAQAHHYLGVSLATRGEVEGAIAQFERALELRPDLPLVRENLRTLRAAQARESSVRRAQRRRAAPSPEGAANR